MVNDIRFAKFSKFSKFSSYAELRDYGLTSKEGSKLWLEWLGLKQKRDNATSNLIKDVRKKHPGLSNSEIVNLHKNYLNKNFHIHSFGNNEIEL